MPFAIRGVSSLGFPEKTNSAFYYSGQIRLGAGDDVTFSKIPQDPSIVIHETCHALIEALAKLPYQGEGGSLNEGFSDFFTTVLLKNPKLGEASYKKGPFKRTVENDKKVSDKKGALYADSGIVSGTLWEIYQKLGQEKSLQFALEILTRLGPNSNFESTSTVMKELLAVEQNDKDKLADNEILKTVLKVRGWL
jgi:Zn-dependent metalloprotease